MVIFDRSWYGRVLDGIRLVKLFFHITPEEQLARFRERLKAQFSPG